MVETGRITKRPEEVKECSGRPDYWLHDHRGICNKNFIRALIGNRRTQHRSAKSEEDTDRERML